jgi:multicomponent Na+:H+ antiporter subunit G
VSAADLLTAVLVLTGCLFFAAGTVGLLRFPDLRTRLHALTKADNLGLGFVVAGLAVQAGSAGEVAKLVLVWALALLAAASSGHLLGRDDPAGGDS